MSLVARLATLRPERELVFAPWRGLEPLPLGRGRLVECRMLTLAETRRNDGTYVVVYERVVPWRERAARWTAARAAALRPAEPVRPAGSKSLPAPTPPSRKVPAFALEL